MESQRGLVAAAAMSIPNDLVDYERDVMCGETNNILRGLTSTQQVIDGMVWFLQALCWALDHGDYDASNATLSGPAIALVLWRYNGPKLFRYRPVPVEDRLPSIPPELKLLSDIVQMPAKTLSYGEFYRQADERVRRRYSGCTCRELPEGHDAWQMFSRAVDECGNDDLEQRLHVAIVALNNGANEGDLRPECTMDLLLYECFVSMFHPETGIIARMHYRTGTELENTITE